MNTKTTGKSSSQNQKTGANSASPTTTSSTTAQLREPIAKTADGRDIYIGDFVKVPKVHKFLKVLSLDSTSDDDHPSLLCFGGANPDGYRLYGREPQGGVAQFVTVFADTTQYQYPVRKTESLRKQRWDKADEEI